MDIPKVKRVAHVVLFVRDPEASARWYGDVLGMQVSARAIEGPYKGGVFLTFGERDHDIALFPTTDNSPRGREFEHIGFEVDCDGDMTRLRRLYGSMLRHQVKINEILDHGVSTGIYFFDPDGHQLEVFCQRVPAIDGASIRELRRNQGQAINVELEPLSE
ncbi:MAG TPA: VOC family protein [Steroidobacteraceae bacterium]|nr:VOC family protein [Steroidobacteraceae bacterium]